MVVITRACSVCNNPNKEKYELMYLEEQRKLIDIWRYARSIGDTISYQALARHFSNHVGKKLAYERGYNKKRNEVLSKVLQQDIEIAKEIRDHLQLIHKQIEKYKERDDLTVEEMRMLQEWINQARLTIEQLLKHEERLMPKTQDIGDLGSKLLKLVEDFPPEYLSKYSERLGLLIDEMRKYGR